MVPKFEILILGEIHSKSDKENLENKEAQINKLDLLFKKIMLIKGKKQLRDLMMFTLI
jgi:hypothetical protein